MKKIIIIIICLMLTGCFNYKELNNYAIVTGLSIDKSDNGYEISALITNAIKENENKTNISVVSGKGKSIYSAIKDINLKIPKELYLSHLNVIIISEEVAKDGMKPILDYLVREPESHQSYYLIISKDTKAKNALSILDPIANFPSENIYSNLENSRDLQSKIIYDKVNQYIGKVLEKGIHPILNSLIIVGSSEKGSNTEEQNNVELKNYIMLDNLAIFKNDKLVDYADSDESVGINILLDNIDEIYIEIPCNKSNIILSSNSLNTKTKVNKQSVNINVDINSKINELGCDIKLNNNNLKKIEKDAEEKIINQIKKALQLSINNKTDIYGYGTRLYKKDYKYFNTIEDWDEYFTNLKFNINVDVKIKDKGSANNTIGVIED